MEELLLFIMSFILVFIIYQVFIIIPAKKRKKFGSSKNKDKELLEVKYLEFMYKIDLKKIKYEQLLQICAIVSSFDISLCVFLVSRTKNLILEILIGFLSIIILILVTYHFVYLFYKKKGMIKQ